MISLSKSGVATCILALSFTSISAQAFSNPPSWYLGLNTGVSNITDQGFGHYDSIIGNPFFIDAREESLQSGYNLGAFIGWNLYACAPFLFGLELSANWHSNRGHYTVDFVNINTQTNSSFSNFEVNYDLEYTVHFTARPAFQINESTLFYFQVGAAYGRFNSEIKNLLPQNDDLLKVEDKEDAWGVTLGTGIQKHLSECFSVFAAYEYTYFGHVDLSPIQKFEATIDRSATLTHGELNRRESVVDSNTFKAGMIFTF